MSAAVDTAPGGSLAPPQGAAVGDRLHVATLVFQRARQLKDGARPRVDPYGHTMVRVALMEVLGGFVIAAP